MKPPVVFIAGPMRANNAWDREQNIRRAEELALEVWRRGCAVICVHAAGRFYDETEARQGRWLEADHELLRRSDAVAVVENWQESEGTAAEIALAEVLGIPVHENLSQLELWLALRMEQALKVPPDRTVEQIASWIEGHGALAAGLAQGVRARAWDGLAVRSRTSDDVIVRDALAAIEGDLCDRRGFKSEWRTIERENPEVLDEIRGEWRKIIEIAMHRAREGR